jgi:hypothetical protein
MTAHTTPCSTDPIQLPPLTRPHPHLRRLPRGSTINNTKLPTLAHNHIDLANLISVAIRLGVVIRSRDGHTRSAMNTNITAGRRASSTFDRFSSLSSTQHDIAHHVPADCAGDSEGHDGARDAEGSQVVRAVVLAEELGAVDAAYVGAHDDPASCQCPLTMSGIPG